MQNINDLCGREDLVVDRNEWGAYTRDHYIFFEDMKSLLITYLWLTTQVFTRNIAQDMLTQSFSLYYKIFRNSYLGKIGMQALSWTASDAEEFLLNPWIDELQMSVSPWELSPFISALRDFQVATTDVAAILTLPVQRDGIIHEINRRYYNADEKGHLNLLTAVLLPISSGMATHNDLGPPYFHNGGGRCKIPILNIGIDDNSHKSYPDIAFQIPTGGSVITLEGEYLDKQHSPTGTRIDGSHNSIPIYYDGQKLVSVEANILLGIAPFLASDWNRYKNYYRQQYYGYNGYISTLPRNNEEKQNLEGFEQFPMIPRAYHAFWGGMIAYYVHVSRSNPSLSIAEYFRQMEDPICPDLSYATMTPWIEGYLNDILQLITLWRAGFTTGRADPRHNDATAIIMQLQLAIDELQKAVPTPKIINDIFDLLRRECGINAAERTLRPRWTPHTDAEILAMQALGGALSSDSIR